MKITYIKTNVTLDITPEEWGQISKMDGLSQLLVLLQPEAKPEPKPEAKPEPKPEAKPEPKPEAKPEAKPEVVAEVKPEPKPEVVAEVKPEPKKESKQKVKKEPKPKAESEPWILEYVEALCKQPSREKAEAMIKESGMFPNKQGLKCLAKAVPIYVQPTDSYDTILANIVEFTVGRKLEHQAIQTCM